MKRLHFTHILHGTFNTFLHDSKCVLTTYMTQFACVRGYINFTIHTLMQQTWYMESNEGWMSPLLGLNNNHFNLDSSDTLILHCIPNIHILYVSRNPLSTSATARSKSGSTCETRWRICMTRGTIHPCKRKEKERRAGKLYLYISMFEMGVFTSLCRQVWDMLQLL